MDYGIITASIATVYQDANWNSSSKIQLLYGEPVVVLKERKNWIQIELNHSESGWIPQQQFSQISIKEYEKMMAHNDTFCFDIYANAISANEHIPLIYGSRLPHFDGLSFKINKQKVVFNGQVFSKPTQVNPEQIKKIALKYINSPYLKGGRTPFGIDSVGLVQMIYRFMGIELPLQMEQLLHFGQTVAFITMLEIGDLVFYNQDETLKIGLYLGEDQVIFSDAMVQIGHLDSHGLIDLKTRSYIGTQLQFKRVVTIN